MNKAPAPAGSHEGGLPYALAAYGIWGFVPLFFKLLTSVPPVEVLAQRILWSLPLCFLIMAFRRQIGEYLAALRDWKLLRLLIASAVLIAVNWLVYIYSIFTDHVLAASLGYYLNPLVNVMLGMIFLGERLSRLQMVAVAIAALGVALLLGGALETLDGADMIYNQPDSTHEPLIAGLPSLTRAAAAAISPSLTCRSVTVVLSNRAL